MNEFKKCYCASVNKTVKSGFFKFLNRKCKNMLYIFYLFTSRIYFKGFVFDLKISCHEGQIAPALSCAGI